jgi:hypothetical protein
MVSAAIRARPSATSMQRGASMRRDVVRAGPGSLISSVPTKAPSRSEIAIEKLRADAPPVTRRKRSVRVWMRFTSQASLGQPAGARYSKRTSSIAACPAAFRVTAVMKNAAAARRRTAEPLRAPSTEASRSAAR